MHIKFLNQIIKPKRALKVLRIPGLTLAIMMCAMGLNLTESDVVAFADVPSYQITLDSSVVARSSRWEQSGNTYKYKLNNGTYATNTVVLDESNGSIYLVGPDGSALSGMLKVPSGTGGYYKFAFSDEADNYGHFIVDGEWYKGCRISVRTKGGLSQLSSQIISDEMLLPNIDAEAQEYFRIHDVKRGSLWDSKTWDIHSYKCYKIGINSNISASSYVSNGEVVGGDINTLLTAHGATNATALQNLPVLDRVMPEASYLTKAGYCNEGDEHHDMSRHYLSHVSLEEFNSYFPNYTVKQIRTFKFSEGTYTLYDCVDRWNPANWLVISEPISGAYSDGWFGIKDIDAAQWR